MEGGADVIWLCGIGQFHIKYLYVGHHFGWSAEQVSPNTP